jgi:exopolysaccharide production protein ExoQ
MKFRISVNVLILYWTSFFYLGSTLLPSGLRTFQFASLYLIAFFIFWIHWKYIYYFLTKDKFLLALLILSGVSYFWSVQPSITFAHFRSMAVQYILAAYIAKNFTTNQLLKNLNLFFKCILILNYIYILIGQGLNRASWAGIFPHQSYFAQTMAITTITVFCAYLVLEAEKKASNLGRFSSWLFIAMSLIAIYFSNARTSLVGVLSVLSIIPFFYLEKIRGLKTRTQCFIILGYVLIVGVSLVTFSTEYIVVGILGKSPDLTGRADLWAHLFTKVAERPILGFGKGAFWHNPELVMEASRMVGRNYSVGYHSHSSYVENLLGLGYPGLTLMLLSIITVLWRNLILFFKYRSLKACWSLQIIIFLAIASFSDTFIGFIQPRGFGSFLFCIIAFMAILELKNFKLAKFSSETYLRKPMFEYSKFLKGNYY